MKYPSDSFYHTHSLHIDLNRSGKDEYDLMKKQLDKFGLTSTNRTIHTSLEILQSIHKFVLENGKKEQKQRLQYLKRNQITGSVTPVDISIAHDVFQHFMNNIDPYYTAALILVGLKSKILDLVRKFKTKDPLDNQTKSLLKKIIENDKKNLIIKKVIEIKLENNRKTRHVVSTRRNKKSKSQKSKSHKKTKNTKHRRT